MKKLFLIAVVVFSFSAHAELVKKANLVDSVPSFDVKNLAFLAKEGNENKTGSGACSNLKLTNAQRHEIRALIKEFQLSKVDLKAEVKKSKIRYSHVVKDLNSSFADANWASKKISSSVLELVQAKLNLANTIFYDVATPEQRMPLMRCFKAHRHKHGKDHKKDAW